MIRLFRALTFPRAWKPKSVNWWHPATSSVFKYGLCWANDMSVWSVSSAHLDTHSFCKFKQVSAIFWMATSVTLCEPWPAPETHKTGPIREKKMRINNENKCIESQLAWQRKASVQLTSQLCRLRTVRDLQYVAKHITALLLTCLHPLLLKRRNLLQPRASASTPFSEIASHHDILISSKFCIRSNEIYQVRIEWGIGWGRLVRTTSTNAKEMATSAQTCRNNITNELPDSRRPSSSDFCR